MFQTVKTVLCTFLILIVLDGIVAATLTYFDQKQRLGALVDYFEYGRSVPGKLERWIERPHIGGNLFNVAWRSDILADSQKNFLSEDPTAGPVIRSYGMSFVNNIIENTLKLNPSYQWDHHSGPGAPPNFTYDLFLADRDNRRAGDVVVLGILSSSLPGMAALSNRTWVFEQPAPFTYPIYWPDGEGLKKIEPLINDGETQKTLSGPALKEWQAFLSEHDAFYATVTSGLTVLDYSPFMRLVRRSLAKSHVQDKETEIMTTDLYPYEAVLKRMIRSFHDMARADQQIPVVMLIQTKAPYPVSLLDLTQSMLEEEKIPYFATESHFDPRDLRGFAPDGHYKKAIDAEFGQLFLDMLSQNP